MPSITRSTTACTATAWPYCASAFRQVTTMITGGISQAIEVSPAEKRSKPCWMTMG